MTDKELIRVTKQFTKGIIGKEETKGKCYRVCLPLQSFLNFLDVETKLIEGYLIINNQHWNHVWLQLEDGRILDPTADQFGFTKKFEVYLDIKPKKYKIFDKQE